VNRRDQDALDVDFTDLPQLYPKCGLEPSHTSASWKKDDVSEATWMMKSCLGLQLPTPSEPLLPNWHVTYHISIGQIKNPNNGFYIGWSFFLLFKLAQIFNSQGTLFFCVPFPKGLFFIKKLKLLLRATTYLIIHRFHVMQLNFFFLAEGMLRYI
jgi:hypothetical protein